MPEQSEDIDITTFTCDRTNKRGPKGPNKGPKGPNKGDYNADFIMVRILMGVITLVDTFTRWTLTRWTLTR